LVPREGGGSMQSVSQPALSLYGDAAEGMALAATVNVFPSNLRNGARHNTW
jgi:hypothetical protein